MTTALILFVSGCVGADAGMDVSTGGPEFEAPDADKAALRGLVTDDQLQPLADVEVAIIDVQPILSTRTNEAGSFALNQIPPGAHKLAVQKLGYEAAARNIELAAGETTEVSIQILPIPVPGEARHITLLGEGYFACGAYLIVTTWGNLHGCVWDNHKPKFDFTVEREGIHGILLEIVWARNSGVTSELLAVSLKYKQVCTPFCSQEQQWGSVQDRSPVRSYVDFTREHKKVKENPMPLSSVTFPGGEGPSTSSNPPKPGSGPVIVFQQRMTHYVTLFWGDHCVPGSEGEECPMQVFTAIPDK